MKRAFLTAVTALMALSLAAPTSANNDKGREGVVTYSLPTTVITLDVAASQESFHAGPYAATHFLAKGSYRKLGSYQKYYKYRGTEKNIRTGST